MCTSETGCACSTTDAAASPATPAATLDGVQQVYQVNGMTCGGCASRVSKQISEVAGVRTVSVDVSTGAVTVTSGGRLDDDAIGGAVTQAGYQLVR
jgi:copper chaperone